MNTLVAKMIIGLIIAAVAIGSYLYYQDARNPVTEALDTLSERAIGVDLDPFIDLVDRLDGDNPKDLKLKRVHNL